MMKLREKPGEPLFLKLGKKSRSVGAILKTIGVRRLGGTNGQGSRCKGEGSTPYQGGRGGCEKKRSQKSLLIRPTLHILLNRPGKDLENKKKSQDAKRITLKGYNKRTIRRGGGAGGRKV